MKFLGETVVVSHAAGSCALGLKPDVGLLYGCIYNTSYSKVLIQDFRLPIMKRVFKSIRSFSTPP